MSFKRAKIKILPANSPYLDAINIPTRELHGFPQHLYIISLDEEIKDGDWVYCTEHNRIIKYLINGDPINGIHGSCCKKIIASTDKSLTYHPEGNDKYVDRNLPQPSPQLIEKYIESYNAGTPITDVLVEYENSRPYSTSGKEYGAKEFIEANLQLKVNSKDNTITIKKLKNQWNIQELNWIIIKILNDSTHAEYSSMSIKDKAAFIDKWTEENL